MKKYKLIKEYPGSPKIPFEVKQGKNSNDYFNKTIFYKRDIENYPEYWQEVIEKDYEILSFTVNKIIFFRNEKGNYISSTIEYTLDHMLFFLKATNNPCIIHSIKRLSDGEVFTIGDNYNLGTIQEIELTKDGTLWFHNGKKSKSGLFVTIKVKQPLFTTEDGVDIFDLVKDEFYYVTKSQFSLVKRAMKGFYYEPEKEWYFSTKEAAQDYIIRNKPCFSYNDVVNKYSMSFIHQSILYEKAKTHCI